ncbi:MAG: phage holin family protein [Pseudomonadota bacterium]
MTATTATPAVAAMNAGPTESPPGLRSGFRLLLDHLGDHLDLLRLELGQELSRFGAVLGCWFALALLLQLALMMGLTLLVASYWNSEYRTHTILLSAALLLGGLGYCAVQLKRLGQGAATRFIASGQQLKRDLDLIREMI